MEKRKIINKIIIAILLIVLVAGIIVIALKGLNFDIMYSDAKRIDLYIEKEYNEKELKQIVKEVLGNQEVTIQQIELYGDAAVVVSKEITEEQKQEIINKVNEKYGSDIKAEDINIVTVPRVRGRDMVKQYIIPFVVASAIIAVYLITRYHKLGILKVLLKTIGIVVLAQLELLSIMAITRIPIGRITIPLIITVYMLTLLGITTKFENILQEMKKEEEKE